ncbi:hypothetical protein IOD06_00795 [Psychrobacter sp. N25K4-3-2]|uniref:hypothetical protein n=1 Tax=Psychrobacter sp. N25K4-3-2 TaxID=2785026 RepID=UPI00188B28DF|nr:hypothetical protein [Psychrobacter sp. N25K4-3-2]MBF4488427.1 hypothetical protein [Psychrobacter sp. N25K4-3-2]
MKNFIRGFVKWVIAGIGLGIGIFIVLVAITLWDKKNKQDTSDDTTAVLSNDTDNSRKENNELLNLQFTVEDQDVPAGYKLIEDGSLMLDAPIMGMEWESIVDENVATEPRVYEPFMIYQCITQNGEHLRLDVINSDIGYMLKYYFATQGNTLKLEAQQAAEGAYYATYLNSTRLIMRDPNNYYQLSQFEDGDTTFYIINTITGQEMNHFSCENNSIENAQYALIAQMEPEHFKFKPMTDELEEILNERFENR